MRAVVGRRVLALLVCAVGGSPAWAVTAAARQDGGPCERLVDAQVRTLASSRLAEWQLAVHTHRTTAMLLDVLDTRLPATGRWREGEQHWEEAYALLSPGVAAHLASVQRNELGYQQQALPPRLDAATCSKHLALLESKLGSLAQRVKDGRAGQGTLAELRKAFPPPARLARLGEAVAAHLGREAALENGPEAQADKAQFASVQKALQAFDARYAKALGALGETPDAAGRKRANQEFTRELVARHRERLQDIIGRYRAANPG